MIVIGCDVVSAESILTAVMGHIQCTGESTPLGKVYGGQVEGSGPRVKPDLEKSRKLKSPDTTSSSDGGFITSMQISESNRGRGQNHHGPDLQTAPSLTSPFPFSFPSGNVKKGRTSSVSFFLSFAPKPSHSQKSQISYKGVCA